MDENDKMCFEKARLIAYSHGEYYALGKKLGKFGFSTDKKKRRPEVKKGGSKKPVKK